MGYQTEVQLGGPLRLPASSALVAQATPEGRAVIWDNANANLILAGDDDRCEYIVDEIHAADLEASVLPFTADRNFRVRMAASPGTLVKGKLAKVSATGGTMQLGGGASDINVGVFEEASVGNGAALIRPLPGGLVTT